MDIFGGDGVLYVWIRKISSHGDVSKWPLYALGLSLVAWSANAYAHEHGHDRMHASDAMPHMAGTVSILEGSAHRQDGLKSNRLTLTSGSKIFAGDYLQTGAQSRMEVTLRDGSKVRLAANAKLHLKEVAIDKRKKTIAAKLILGRVWAAVTQLMGNSRFEVTTVNAVAGVRGTRFSTAIVADGATEVKVYDGAVLVSNKPVYAIQGHTRSTRQRVAGPAQISKKAWQEQIAQAMQSIRVSKDGALGQAQAFQSAAVDRFEAWNQKMDSQAGLVH